MIFAVVVSYWHFVRRFTKLNFFNWPTDASYLTPKNEDDEKNEVANAISAEHF